MYSIDFESLDELMQALEAAEETPRQPEYEEFEVEFDCIIGEETFSLQISIYGKG